MSHPCFKCYWETCVRNHLGECIRCGDKGIVSKEESDEDFQGVTSNDEENAMYLCQVAAHKPTPKFVKRTRVVRYLNGAKARKEEYIVDTRKNRRVL